MHHIKKLSTFILIIYLAAACTYDNEDEFYSAEDCSLTDVSFSTTILPIVDRNCIGCHFQGNATGVTLATYDDIVDEVENGKLLGSIKHSPGIEPMPKGGKLDDCTVQKIETWINNGTPNN